MAFTTSRKIERWLIALRVSIGIIYLWFGVLKFFSGVSPAEELAKQTIHLLTFKMIGPEISLLILAIWESTVGILLIAGIYTTITIRIVLIHMFCTFAPLFLLPGLSFTSAPLSLTLVGQYIIKNIVIICALFVVDAAQQKK
jgi:uncharacterized membrane protein YphA (DoxX/SURF4 family)